MSNTTHGCSGTLLYMVWTQVKQRCSNSNDSDYDNYGGRGITVCPEWDDFVVFRDWALANGYEEGLTIEREDNDLGYSPENCVFSTRLVQSRNRRRYKINTSGYVGVYFNKKNGNWTCNIPVNKKQVHLGSYSSALLASIARDEYILKHGLPCTLNYTEEPDMAKAVKQQSNFNLYKSTALYITRTAKREGITKAELVENAIKAYKQAA